METAIDHMLDAAEEEFLDHARGEPTPREARPRCMTLRELLEERGMCDLPLRLGAVELPLLHHVGTRDGRLRFRGLASRPPEVVVDYAGRVSQLRRSTEYELVLDPSVEVRIVAGVIELLLG